MEQKARWYGSKQIGMMLYTAILFLIGTSIIGGNNNTVYPMFAEIRGWDIALINTVSGFAVLAKALGVLLFAKFVPRLGPKLVVIITLLISAVCLLLFGFTEDIMVFFVMMIIIGLLGGGYEKNGGVVMTANWWPTKKGVVLGFTTIGICAVNFLYVPVMPKLLGALGLFGGMAVIAGILIVVVIITILLVKNTPEEAGAFPDGDPNYETVGADIARQMKEYRSPFTVAKMLSDKNTYFLALGAGLAFMAVMTFVPSGITAMINAGIEPGLATGIYAIAGIGCIPGSFIFGVIDQKLGTKKAFIIYFVFIITGFVFLQFMASSLACTWIASWIIFSANGALGNLFPSYVATIYGRWDYSAAYKVLGTIFEFLPGIGIILVGVFYSNLFLLYKISLVLTIIGFVLMLFTKPTFIGKKG